MTAFLIAGTASGVGKTTVTLAVIAALRQRGVQVQAFKGGPDFLDTTHHTRVSGRPARNLDTWMLSHEANREVFRRGCGQGEAAVVEGMMGLYDGKDAATDTGSSAEIARVLGLPVVLVVDAAKSARSMAATVLGFELFDPNLQLAGVILNRVGSANHLRLLTEAIASRCATPVLGSLPRVPEIAIPERHLGLHAAPSSDQGIDEQMDRLASLAEDRFDLDRLLALQAADEQLPVTAQVTDPPQPRVRLGVAQDEAFSFLYQDNLDLLQASGAEIVPFSPLQDAHLPAHLDGLYLCGGYPELHAEQLSANQAMLANIREFAASGRPVYAECGGMIYLGERVGETLLAGVLPLRVEMTSRLVDFGYVTAHFTRDCLLGPAGTELRGHSFHYSRLLEPPQMTSSYQVEYSLSGRVQEEGFTQGGVLASYVHLHFGANPQVARNFVTAMQKRKEAGTDRLTGATTRS